MDNEWEQLRQQRLQRTKAEKERGRALFHRERRKQQLKKMAATHGWQLHSVVALRKHYEHTLAIEREAARMVSSATDVLPASQHQQDIMAAAPPVKEAAAWPAGGWRGFEEYASGLFALQHHGSGEQRFELLFNNYARSDLAGGIDSATFWRLLQSFVRPGAGHVLEQDEELQLPPQLDPPLPAIADNLATDASAQVYFSRLYPWLKGAILRSGHTWHGGDLSLSECFDILSSHPSVLRKIQLDVNLFATEARRLDKYDDEEVKRIEAEIQAVKDKDKQLGAGSGDDADAEAAEDYAEAEESESEEAEQAEQAEAER